MRQSRNILFVTLLLASAFTGWAGEMKLPSGRILKDAQYGPMYFTTGLPPAWVIKYVTTEDIDDKKAVSAEVMEIWSYIRMDVESRKFKSAIIMAQTAGTGLIITKRQQRNFTFERQDDGEWKIGIPTMWREEPQPGATDNPGDAQRLREDH